MTYLIAAMEIDVDPHPSYNFPMPRKKERSDDGASLRRPSSVDEGLDVN